MSAWPSETGTVVELSGSADRRGRDQAARGGAAAAAVREGTQARVEAARAEGVLDADAESYLAAQRRFCEQSDPHSMAELAGIAEGFAIDEPLLFAYLHLSVLRDRKASASLSDADGCSAWATGEGADGPLLAKNRDFAGSHRGIQRVFRHAGPDVATGAMLCVGSLGATGAYSSGMNEAGLALADTAVATRDHGVGWLRYFLMSRILAECASVDEALAFVRARPHAGGGSLVLADRSGAVAAVELGHRRLAMERGRLAFRTNHFVSDELADTTLAGGDRVARNSRERLAILARRLPRTAWTAAQAASLMASHGATQEAASLCQHAGGGEAFTISSAVFACRSRTLYLAEGNPCGGIWKRYGLDR